MESSDNAAATGFRRHHHHRKPPASIHLLSVPPHSFPYSTNSQKTELTEHDIFCYSPDFSPASSSALPTPTSSSSVHNSHNHEGILAALPVEPDSESRSVFNHKASSASVSPSPSAASLGSLSATPSPSSSARLTIPKRPPQPRKIFQQSAPVNVPVLSEAMRRSRASRGFDDVIEDNDDEEENEFNAEFMPPHEIVASKQTPMMACSVLEGVGRTLKGRDLRQVRNAVWRKTGFLD